jgi:hypothetical protein
MEKINLKTPLIILSFMSLGVHFWSCNQHIVVLHGPHNQSRLMISNTIFWDSHDDDAGVKSFETYGSLSILSPALTRRVYNGANDAWRAAERC